MSLRWPRYLPRFPAILLMPTVLTAWAMVWVHPVCERGGSLGGWGSDFPLTFWVIDLNYGGLGNMPDEHTWGILGLWAFLVDTSLALTAAYVVAMGVDRLLFPWIRGVRRRKLGQKRRTDSLPMMRPRWTTWLPGFPAMLLSIAVLGLWVVLSVSPRIHLRPLKAWIYMVEPGSSMGEPGTYVLTPREALGFPLLFIDTKYERIPGGGFTKRPVYYLGRFLVDLALAFAAVYILPMALDRLVFPAVRARGRRNRGPVEPN